MVPGGGGGGNGFALGRLAYAYEYGKLNLAIDLEAALTWYQEAAKGGDGGAQW